MRLFVIAILCFFTASCNDAGDPLECLREVKKAYPSARIVPKTGYKFIVIYPDKIYQVECLMLSSPEISSSKQITPL